jgi:hypothetical protein
MAPPWPEENRMNLPETPAPAAAPWWRVGMVWLVLSGPLVVVVAACVTAVIAIRGADIVVTDAPAASKSGAETPALQARNHAATGGR